MLGDLLAKGHDEEKAMHHYNVALNLDPKNISAQEGLQKMEQQLKPWRVSQRSGALPELARVVNSTSYPPWAFGEIASSRQSHLPTN